MEDLQIIELYWSRDPQAIAQSQDKYGPYCFSVAHGILESLEDSEECVNDTWVAAWNGMPPHRPDYLRMFLAKITRRLAFNRYKAAMAQKRGGGQMALVLEELEECVAGSQNVEDSFDARELGRSVRKFVENLPAREGDVFCPPVFLRGTGGKDRPDLWIDGKPCVSASQPGAETASGTLARGGLSG